ncbi:MAG: nickel pincer cofactor biosynthesis protein LarC, partial [Candidatus Aenigmatarchaeota archaeon]
MLERDIVVIDCRTGISGDMLLGALLDLGASQKKVLDVAKLIEKNLKCNIKLKIKNVNKGIGAKSVEVETEEKGKFSGQELLKATRECLRKIELTEKAKEFVLNSILTLIKAETKVHREAFKKVHFHEIGSPDTLVDIIGVGVAADDLEIFKKKIFSTPVGVGGGLFKFSHGVTSSPAPATLEILKSKNFPLVGGPVNSELATPTGVSMLVNLAQEVVRFYPAMKVISTGYGAGRKDFPGMPNVLRIILAQPYNHALAEEIYVLETNVDDVTGETIGYTTEKLLKEGAKDVCIIPMFTKKGRPGQIIRVLSDEKKLEKLVKILTEETGTLGVRVSKLFRYTLKRELIPLKIRMKKVEEIVRVKVAKDEKGRTINIKPEYEDVKKIAEKVQVAFLCVPSGKAQEMAYAFLQKGVKVIDFSADFRFKNVQ